MMASNRTLWIEGGVDAGAAALFAAAAAMVMVQFTADPALVLAIPLLAFAGCFAGLRAVQPSIAFAPPRFDAGEIVAGSAAELMLTATDRLAPGDVLPERALAHDEPGSKVVQLFEPATMPTPGELKVRIDRHRANGPNVRSDDGQTAPPDASQALFEALSELRRSLR